MIIKAPAKINICLNVVGQTTNNYHLIDMINAPLALHDTIKIQLAKKTSIKTNDANLSNENDNLCIKAINIMREHFNFDENFTVDLIKRIPSQAGLGGGSSDAASIMKAIVKILCLNTTEQQMIKIARKIGSDVPFFYIGTFARVSGTGEIVKPIMIKNKYRILIIKPKEGLSTKLVYSQCDQYELRPYNITQAINYLESGDDNQLAKTIGNHLEVPAIELCPTISNIKELLRKDGFNIAMMSGSGTAVYAMVKKGTHLNKIRKKYQTLGYQVFLTSIQDYNIR
jgi:4-diphosphocytidyl-2-C-methyl-D-erythritol kinase